MLRWEKPSSEAQRPGIISICGEPGSALKINLTYTQTAPRASSASAGSHLHAMDNPQTIHQQQLMACLVRAVPTSLASARSCSFSSSCTLPDSQCRLASSASAGSCLHAVYKHHTHHQQQLRAGFARCTASTSIIVVSCELFFTFAY